MNGIQSQQQLENTNETLRQLEEHYRQREAVGMSVDIVRIDQRLTSVETALIQV